MKAILIDSKNKKVSYVEIDKEKGLDDYYKHLKCECFTGAISFDNNDMLMVDDEGLMNLRHDTMFFTIEGGYQPFAGNGLIVGGDDDGDSVDVKLTLSDLKGKIKFYNITEVRELL